MEWARLAFPLICAGCAAQGPSTTDEALAPARTRRIAEGTRHEAFALTVENDGVVGTDNNYTNGVALSWISRERSAYSEDSARGRWIDLGSFLPFVGDPGYRSFASVSLGHEMFTPDNILAPRPPPEDRPYAGVLFLDTTFFALRDELAHAWSLRVGAVGPSSGAADAQRSIHKWTGSDGPQGWSEQLPNEPILNLDYSIAHKSLTGGEAGAYSWRLVPVGAAGLGTYFTGMGTAIYGEWGWRLPEAVGHVTLRRGVDPFTTIGSKQPVSSSVSMIAGAGVFAVLHYLPLDGTVTRTSPSVDSEPLIGFVSGGLSYRRGRLAVGLLLTSFTDTFEGQPSSETFGTFSLSWSP